MIQQAILEALPGKLDIIRLSPSILYLQLITHLWCLLSSTDNISEILDLDQARLIVRPDLDPKTIWHSDDIPDLFCV